MRISAKVKAGAKIDRVEKISDKEFMVWVKQEAKEGRANQAVVKLLSEYFHIPKSRITILKGHTSRNKIIEI